MGLLYQMIVGDSVGSEAVNKVRNLTIDELLDKMDAYLVMEEEDGE